MKNLSKDYYFAAPVYIVQDDTFVNHFLRVTDPYIKKAREHNKEAIEATHDFGLSHHSTSLIPNKTANNIMYDMGYDLKNHQMFINELWVQEFSRNGGGWHETHTHWNGHISGFYFLKGSEQTSRPVFHDPRPGKVMNDLPLLNKDAINDAQHVINYSIKPGTMIFFPSYLPHSYLVDHGKEPFRFIHWNIQAIPKSALNNATNK